MGCGVWARGWVGRLNKSEREEDGGGSEKEEHQPEDVKETGSAISDSQ